MRRLFINSHEVTPEEFDSIMGKGKAEAYLRLFGQRLRTAGYAFHASETLGGEYVMVYAEDGEVLDELHRLINGIKR